MIFISSTVPLNEIPTSKEEICKSDWFLFSTMVNKKDYQKDNELNGIYYQLHLYPYFYTQIYIATLCQIITIIKAIYVRQCKTHHNSLV